MKDAYGGILNLVFVVVFLLIVIAVLGLVVSYTKAFRMKNARILAYSPVMTDCSRNDGDNEYYNALNYYCFTADKDGNYLTVRVMTQVNIELPILKEIMGFNIFRVSGDTRRIYLNQ